MIKNLEQAVKIQQRRKNSGKRGHAKAVRRYIQKQFRNQYRDVIDRLPVTWVEPGKKAA